jgi:hypothetical protein
MSFAVASTDKRYSLDDTLIASFSRRYRVKVMEQSDGARLVSNVQRLVFEYDQMNL